MRYRLIALAAMTFLAIASFSPSSAHAAQYRADTSGSVNISGPVGDDLYAAGATVNLSAPVSGDVVMAAGTAVFASAVGESLLAAGANITVIGDVGDDVRAFGGNLLISGKVKHDVIVLGGQVTVSGSSDIGGDLIVLGGNVTVDGTVNGNLFVRSGQVMLNGTVKGSTDISGRKIDLGDGAAIGGRLIYSSPAEMQIRSGIAAGGVEFRQIQMRTSAENRGGVAAIITVAFFVKMLTLLVLALILAAVFRRRVLAMNSAAYSAFGWDLLRGFGALIIAPIAGIVLLMTVIGAPIAALAFLVFGILLILSGIMAPILMGSLIWKLVRRGGAYEVNAYSIIIGVAVFALFGLIPVIGWIADSVFTLVALGTLTRWVFGAIRTEQEGTRRGK